MARYAGGAYVPQCLPVKWPPWSSPSTSAYGATLEEDHCVEPQQLDQTDRQSPCQQQKETFNGPLFREYAANPIMLLLPWQFRIRN